MTKNVLEQGNDVEKELMNQINDSIDKEVIEEADAIVGEISRNISSHALKNLRNYAVTSAKGNADKIVVTIEKY